MAFVGISSAKQGALAGALAGVSSTVNPVSSGASSGSFNGAVSVPVQQLSSSNFNTFPSTVRVNDAADAINKIVSNAEANTSKSLAEAQLNREWQEQQNAKAMAFNQAEAQKNRDWQQMMSNTAHQREIADLKAAGLNPVLSAMNGNGASVTSGATAAGVTSSGSTGQVDTSANSAIVNLLASMYNRATQLEMANINARNQENVAKMYTEMNRIVANINADTSKENTSKQVISNLLKANNIWSGVQSIGYMLGDLISGSKLAKKIFG